MPKTNGKYFPFSCLPNSSNLHRQFPLRTRAAPIQRRNGQSHKSQTHTSPITLSVGPLAVGTRELPQFSYHLLLRPLLLLLALSVSALVPFRCNRQTSPPPSRGGGGGGNSELAEGRSESFSEDERDRLDHQGRRDLPEVRQVRRRQAEGAQRLRGRCLRPPLLRRRGRRRSRRSGHHRVMNSS